MSETLAALAAAVIDAPADRTVRLVCADALDESGEPAHAARAEFVRGQIELESLPDDDPRRAALVARCDELFAEHWIDWWRPICEAVGLPEPFVPGSGMGERLKRFVGREKRPPGAPYTRSSDYPGACSVHSAHHNFVAQFIGGFPELLYFPATSPGEGTLARWATTVPLARLRFGSFTAAQFLREIDGEHLAKVSELTLDRLDLEVAALAARSPHLAGLAALKVLPTGHAAAGVLELVYRPTWAGLRSLTLTGVTPPDAVRTLAERSTLEGLESLSLGVGEVGNLLQPFGGLAGPLGQMLGEMFAQFFAGFPLTSGPVRWADYWPALEALARSPLVPRLRTLRLFDANATPSPNDLILRLMRQAAGDPPAPADPDGVFPDTLVRALADGLDPDRLVRLELPAARLSPAARADLARRFGPRAAPA